MIPHSRPSLGPEEKSAVEEVLNSGQIAQGRQVIEFERKFCQLVDRRFAVATSSGTSALHLGLLALGMTNADEVILPSFTCTALLHAIDAVGAKPVLVDIDPEDFNLSVSDVKKKIRRKTKLIMVPHLLGRAAQIEELLKFGVPILEDGTQALGARLGKERVGGFGILSVFSFYATKMITTGEGGMVLTDSPRLAERLHDLRDYDKKENYKFRTNSKMTDLEAAMGIEQLKKLPQFIRRRRQIAKRYDVALQGTGLIPPAEDSYRKSVYFRYVARVAKKTKEWYRFMTGQGIEVKGPIYKPLHQYLGLTDSDFPATSRAMKECFSIPIYPSLTDEECGQVCTGLQRARESRGKEALALTL